MSGKELKSHDDPARVPKAQTSEDPAFIGEAPDGDRPIERRSGELGFSFNEVLIVVAIIGILSVSVVGEMLSAIEKAKLSACMANMQTIRESVWENCDGVSARSVGPTR